VAKLTRKARMPITREPDDWGPTEIPADYWATRRPYIVNRGQVWIGEPGAHHDSAPAEMKGPDSSYGEIYRDEIRPYEHHDPDPRHKSLVEAAWRIHPARAEPKGHTCWRP
jgi:hypothetical protein